MDKNAALSDFFSMIRDCVFFAVVAALGYVGKLQEQSIVMMLYAYVGWRYMVRHTQVAVGSNGGAGGGGGLPPSQSTPRFQALSNVPIREEHREPIVPPPPTKRNALSLLDAMRFAYGKFAPAIWILLSAVILVTYNEARAHRARGAAITMTTEVRR